MFILNKKTKIYYDGTICLKKSLLFLFYFLFEILAEICVCKGFEI
ncbi:hypothetical protein Palpr_0561 [Paludibacter propionicigenes WB4]|uniref:Uncharacterized protein n=1 Tax=Paludibacter propionicigenes (strain DSM 17365 / JCM 13257 / WB4) TaxID=694427 RepID=E4T1X6_PALPW|nr:hypothetical protein Palpr_0561 [Paludibacter propionicigenes WB4]